MQKVRVGNIEIVALIDTIQAYPAADVYPEAGGALENYRHYLEADGTLALNFASFLFEDGGTTVLVDTGWGPAYEGKLLEELDAAGVDAGDVDIVIFTHLHGDHTGWNLDAATGRPRFSKARYLVPGADWAHYSKQGNPASSFETDVRPLSNAGVMDLFDGEKVLTPSAIAVPTPGHTPGHTSVAITSAGEHAFILGDVVLSHIDAENPSWPNSFDWDNETARATRERTVSRLVENQAMVGASHLPIPGFGRFVRRGAGTAWDPHQPSSHT